MKQFYLFRWQLRLFLAVALLCFMTGRVIAAEVVVEIWKMQFRPQEITVKKGTVIRWKNIEKRQYHSVWFEKSGDPEPDYFFPGESYTRSFKAKGDFPYRCGPHPEMTGVVHVVD